MRLKSKSSKLLIFSCFLISSQICIVHTNELTVIESFPKSSVILGKSGAEAEMAYFTQKFFFVHKRDVLGEPMLNFLRKYVEMQQGNEVSLSIHWTQADKSSKTSRYKHRRTFCYNYLLDHTLRENGIYYDPDPSRITETELLITFDYYTRIHRKHLVLQCPVKVKQQNSHLFFMRFKKNGTSANSSYFVLASTSPTEIASLFVLMYTTQKVTTEREKKPENVPLSSIQEEQVLDDYVGPINFRRIMKVPKESTSSEIVLFGKAAERVFITSSNFYFINLDLSDWFVDKFIQLMEKMRKENEIAFSLRQDNQFKSQVCNGHIKYNPALSLRQYTPDTERIGDGQAVEIVTRKTSFPHTQLPEFSFVVPMLACPALFGPQQESKIVYIQLVADTNSNNWVFALLESSRNPDTVYPATFSVRNRALDPRTLDMMAEEIPPIDEGGETIQSAGEISAGPST